VILFCSLDIQGHDPLREIGKIQCVNLPKEYPKFKESACLFGSFRGITCFFSDKIRDITFKNYVVIQKFTNENNTVSSVGCRGKISPAYTYAIV
jgi:hypothetical protein